MTYGCVGGGLLLACFFNPRRRSQRPRFAGDYCQGLAVQTKGLCGVIFTAQVEGLHGHGRPILENKVGDAGFGLKLGEKCLYGSIIGQL